VTNDGVHISFFEIPKSDFSRFCGKCLSKSLAWQLAEPNTLILGWVEHIPDFKVEGEVLQLLDQRLINEKRELRSVLELRGEVLPFS